MSGLSAGANRARVAARAASRSHGRNQWANGWQRLSLGDTTAICDGMLDYVKGSARW